MLKVDQGFFEKGEGNPEASTGTHNIECFDFSVDEFDVTIDESFYGWTRCYATMSNEVEEIGVERWMLTQRRKGVRGQALAAIWSLQQFQ